MTQNPKSCALGNNTDSELVLNDLDEETTNSQDIIITNEKLKTENLGKTPEIKAASKIEVIKLEVEHIKEELLSIDKEALQNDFKKYEEILILKTIELDDIESHGVEEVREMRKDAIQFVQECLKLLDELIEE
ncbi:unnamed protein product [Ceutorhynchus assimilis]|uniref:BAG domain-containing protein n=1 Tax=Ceutorhynchus assimilis TaxID=467358 RepID=A0A9N9MZT3_9CUCU|nr:unnamed protein product [Ceutorhynchus assimilis]